MGEEFRTPGQLLEHLLKERGWTRRVLAIVLGMDETAISKLVLDKRPITPEIALAFEEVFGIEAERFLGLQKTYDLHMAKFKARPDPGRATRAELFSKLPIPEMIQRGWLNASGVQNLPEVERALMQFFGVSSVEEIEILPHAAKKTSVAGGTTAAQLAWLYRVRSMADEMIVAKYDQASGQRCVSKLKSLLAAAEEARKVPRILAEHGIRFVLVETLKTAKIDGVCFWLDEQSPVIAMTTRYDRIDNFWFVLRHELEHMLRRDGVNETAIDVELEGEKAGTGRNIPKEERIANEAAATYCVSSEALEAFIIRKSPYFAERDILGFARTHHIHPGLVAGQLQHKTGRYDVFRDHLVKIRSFVAPSAVVDGWGDVAPVGH